MCLIQKYTNKNDNNRKILIKIISIRANFHIRFGGNLIGMVTHLNVTVNKKPSNIIENKMKVLKTLPKK